MQSFISDNLIADKLIAAHDGAVALLYIWLCRNGEYSAEKAARDLCMTAKEIENAFEKLKRLEMTPVAAVSDTKPRYTEPEEKLPEYTAQDIVERTASDEGFKAVISECQGIFGRMLSSSDMRTLFGIYDHLGFSPELLCLLLHYCAEVFAAKYGTGRLPTMRSIEKEAYAWANREILTLEQAEEYIVNAAQRRSDAGKIQELLNLRGRPLTATESKYIGAWLDMGFEADALALAYDRTVTNTGALKWGYMNKILLSWHEKGIHTAAEAEEKDSRKPSMSSGGGKNEVDLDYLKAVYEKVKNNNK